MTTSIPKPRTTSFASSTHSPTTISIPLGSRVVLTKRRSGWVRYIGKLKNEAGEWYGIALDEGKGDCDGSHQKERYFDCAAHHGVFVRRKEIFCVKEYPARTKGGPPSPAAHDNSDAGSSTSSSVDLHDATHLSPLPASDVPAPPAPSSSSMAQQATAVITPLVRTFKSFRKELGLQISPTKLASNNHHHTGSSVTSGSHAANSPKAAQPTTLSSTAATKSSGLRSPSSSRFGSFSSASTASRTASIVSQMVVAPLDKPSHPSGAKTLVKPPSSPPPVPTEPPASTERDEQQRQQVRTQDTNRTESSLADLLGDSDSISSLSDLYRDALPEVPPTEVPLPGPATSTSSSTSSDSPSVSPTSTSSTSSTASSSRTESVASLSPRTGAPPAVTRVSSFSTMTAVESIKSSRQAEPAPLFFRRANIGSPTLSRRASFTNGGMSPSHSGSSSSGRTSPTHAAAATRMAELEKEISAMKTNHENIVAVLRATNKQHAANVLELRAQVEALTEGNHWLEKQLASKNALIAELREMESSGDRVPRAEVESIIAIKDAQIQTLEREIAKLKQQVLRIETEKDSILCQQMRHARWRHESDETRIAKLREDVLAMVRSLCVSTTLGLLA